MAWHGVGNGSSGVFPLALALTGGYCYMPFGYEMHYTVIKYESVEVPGAVNYAIFSDFKAILTGPQDLEVPWIPVGQ